MYTSEYGDRNSREPTMTVVVGTEEFRKPINVYRDLTRCFSATRQSSGHSVYVE